jgi:hypothetical protein
MISGEVLHEMAKVVLVMAAGLNDTGVYEAPEAADRLLSDSAWPAGRVYNTLYTFACGVSDDPFLLDHTREARRIVGFSVAEIAEALYFGVHYGDLVERLDSLQEIIGTHKKWSLVQMIRAGGLLAELAPRDPHFALVGPGIEAYHARWQRQEKVGFDQVRDELLKTLDLLENAGGNRS